MDYKNKTVIVTGSSAGIGAAIAKSFVKEGANVVITGRNEANLKRISEECSKYGKQPLMVIADITKEEDLKNIITKTIEKYKKIDVLVNNAGMVKFGSILDGNILRVHNEVMTTNLNSAIFLTTFAAPFLGESKGNIVNISSIAGSVPVQPEMTSYGISKAGMDYFTVMSAKELASIGVRVNSVSPGPVQTDMLKTAGVVKDDEYWETFRVGTLLNRVSDPEEIADLVLFLASDKAKGITGSIFLSDNGMKLASR